MTRSVEVRDELVEALRLDLVGPTTAGRYADEVLEETPSAWYLTGFLVPFEAEEAVRRGADADDVVDVAEPGGFDDDSDAGDRVSARRTWFASSIGLSVLLPGESDLLPGESATLSVVVRWGDYVAEKAPKEAPSRVRRLWRRQARQAQLQLPLTAPFARHEVPGSHTTEEGCRGLQVVTYCRTVTAAGPLQGARSVSVFLVNHRTPAPKLLKDQAFAFQAGFELRCDAGLLARTDPRGQVDEDYDERTSDLHYRDVGEHAVGHGVASRAFLDEDGPCRRVETAWMPEGSVPRVEAPLEDVEVAMETLSGLADPAPQLQGLVEKYGDWIETQTRDILKLDAPAEGELGRRRREIGEHLLTRATVARRRIAEGIEALGADADILKAFQLTNRVMARAARQRSPERYPAGEVPEWRLFQLAFLLMNLRATAEPKHADRKIVDLIFFPTGGGKTEAYLGLAAFTMVLRRLQNPGISSAGLSVLMRYTLRLLTLDQLGRAATLVCALELERVDDPSLGEWPFEIGLWVGSGATPNRMGRKGDNLSGTARSLVIAYQNDTTKQPPIPLTECPWCGASFKVHPRTGKPTAAAFKLVGPDGKLNRDEPTNLQVRCLNKSCDFHAKGKMGHLPVLTVDEPIYRRLPAFLISTVDKLAALPWTGSTGGLFGKVERYDALGFYGPCDPPGIGEPLSGGSLLPPDLVIQDELHLISGPLGTMVGLYETVIDHLSTREIDGEEIRPKVVASTATVRQASSQIRAIFGRNQVDIFPPPGPDRDDSFFARTIPVSDQDPGRLYLGVAAPGRSLKVVLWRTYVALLSAGQAFYAGSPKNEHNPADPYLTLLGYFSSLKELGGSRRIVEDEVRNRASYYSRRLRWQESQGMFVDRRLSRDVAELTSRETTDRVSATKASLNLPFCKKGSIDVALATNMISVGLDIERLGLMVVMGQPKSTAEYIQATSRVGRDKSRPGLVVTLFNAHRPRDRSHYERFEHYHTTFYRSVEATSVTPFSERAVDRALPGVVVALARHGERALTPPRGAGAIGDYLGGLGFVGDVLARRFDGHRQWSDDAERAEAKLRGNRIRSEVADLLDEWEKVAHDKAEGSLQYAPGEVKGGAQPLLCMPLEQPPPKSYRFRAGRSLRDVEPSVNLWLRFPDRDDYEEDEP